jgi:DNA-directed RNA polymerase subunit M/transcription elongation factor TFIIS
MASLNFPKIEAPSFSTPVLNEITLPALYPTPKFSVAAPPFTPPISQAPPAAPTVAAPPVPISVPIPQISVPIPQISTPIQNPIQLPPPVPTPAFPVIQLPTFSVSVPPLPKSGEGVVRVPTVGVDQGQVFVLPKPEPFVLPASHVPIPVPPVVKGGGGEVVVPKIEMPSIIMPPIYQGGGGVPVPPLVEGPPLVLSGEIASGDQGIVETLVGLVGETLGLKIYKCLVEAYPEPHSRMIKSRSLCLNLDPTNYINNVEFINVVKRGDITPEELVVMPARRYFPQRWEHETNRLQHTIITRAKGDKMLPVSDKYVCGQCKETQVNVHQTPGRGDEGARVWFTCMSCGHKWMKST